MPRSKSSTSKTNTGTNKTPSAQPSQNTDTPQNQIPADVFKTLDTKQAPKSGNISEWGNFLMQQMVVLNHNIIAVANCASFASDQAHAALQKAETVEKEVKSLAESVSKVEEDNKKIKVHNSRLKERTIRLECHQRKENLKFDGIKEEKDETEEKCRTKILESIVNIPDLDNESVILSRCYRVGRYQKERTRSIVCHVHYYEHKVKILKNKDHLADGIFVSEDYPDEIEERRKTLRPILSMALDIEHYKGKCFLNMDRLIINNRVYTCAPIYNLDELPEDLNPRSLCEKSDEDTHVYFGINSPFSNFHPSPFMVDGVQYVCNEQYIQSKKAELFGDDYAHAQIMESTSPYAMKKRGSRIHNFSKKTWQKKAKDIAKKGALHKFASNDRLKKVLLDTGNKTLAEATKEPMWGMGYTLKDEEVLHSDLWEQVGIMGDVLMDIREMLQSS